MSGNGNEKLRAIFLASLMFFWLFAGTMAFAGAATAQEEPEPGEDEAILLDADGQQVGDDSYATIQDAVNDAEANDGVTVSVGPGNYPESVEIDVEGLTLEGPNAGIAGDSDQRGAEASFNVGGAITADGVTIDGVELTTGSGFSRVTGENTVIRNTVGDVDGSAVVRLETGSDGTVITQNAFTGDGGNFLINARQGARSGAPSIDGVEITDNSFEDVTGEGKTAIQAAGFTNAEISGNSFDGISEDAVRLAGDVSGTEVTDNEFSDYAQDSSISSGDIDAGAVVAVGVSGDVDISGNQFNDAGGDNVYVNTILRSDPAAIELDAVRGSNSFETTPVVSGDTVVPETAVDVVNVDQRTGYSAEDAIRNAISEANPGDTIEVRESDSGYSEFDITIDSLTLKAADSAEPTINIGSDSRINVPGNDVTINGFSIVFEGQATYVRGNNVAIKNNRFELPDGAESQGYAVRYEGLTSNGEVRNNTFTGITNTESSEFGNGVIIAGPDGHEVIENEFAGNSIGVNVGKQQPAGDLLVQNNTFTEHDDFAIALNHDDNKTPQITIEKNSFNSNELSVLALSAGDITVAENNFDDSGIDASTLSGSGVDATQNWWGDASGPSDTGPGSGASVSQNVDFRPWLDAPDGAPVDTTKTSIVNGEAEVEDPTVTEGTSISFDEVPGEEEQLTITERSRPSDEAETAVTTVVEETPETTASEPLAAIEVTNAPDTSATIQITLAAADVADPSSVGIVRVPDGSDEPEILPTDVASTNEEAGTITFEADTPGFSTFVAAELTPAEVSFDRSNLAVTPEEVDVGEEATISLDLTNTGDRSAAAGVAVSVDGERAVSQVRGPVAPGETQTVSLNVSLSQPGEQTISVAGVDETATVTVAGDAVDPSVTIEDQQATGQAESVTVASATAPEAYVIAVHEADDSDDDALSFDIRGVSEPFAAGASATDVTIELDEPITQSQNVTAMLHAVDEDAENNLGAPLTVDGEPVTDAATLTVDTEGEGLERFDQAGTGTITFDDVLAAIEANNTDEGIGGEPVTFEDVLAVIEANNEGTTFEV